MDSICTSQGIEVDEKEQKEIEELEKVLINPEVHLTEAKIREEMGDSSLERLKKEDATQGEQSLEPP